MFSRRPGVANTVEIYPLFSAEEIPADSSSTSEILDLRGRTGIFSVYYEITGSGTLKLEYLISHDGKNFVNPTGATEIGADLTASSGTDSDGKDILDFDPEIAPFIKIKATETGKSDAPTLTLSIAVQ